MVLDRHGALQRLPFWLTLAAAVAPVVSIATSHTLLALAFTALLAEWAAKRDARLRFPPIGLPLALFLGGTVLSLLVSGHIAEGWPQIRKFYVILLPLATVATAFRRTGDGVSLVCWWALGASCSAVLGLYQFTQRFLAARETGAGLYEALVGNRITGFMNLWMTFGGQLMIALLMVMALLMFSKRGRRRGALLAAAALLIALGLAFTLTRGPWVGVGAGALYLIWRWNRRALLAAPVLLAALFFLAPSTLRERVASIAQPRSQLDSNQHRILVWRTGLEMIRAHPWFGLGPEQVAAQFEDYIPADFPRPLPLGWRRHLHNIYLQYGAERGVPVLLAFLWLIAKALRDFWRAARSRPSGPDAPKALLHGAIAVIIAALVAGVFEHNLGDSEVLQMFLTVVALGYCVRGQEQPAGTPPAVNQYL